MDILTKGHREHAHLLIESTMAFRAAFPGDEVTNTDILAAYLRRAFTTIDALEERLAMLNGVASYGFQDGIEIYNTLENTWFIVANGEGGAGQPPPTWLCDDLQWRTENELLVYDPDFGYHMYDSRDAAFATLKRWDEERTEGGDANEVR